MKQIKTNIINKAILITIVIFSQSLSWGILSRLRPGLQECVKAATLYRNTLTRPALKAVTTQQAQTFTQLPIYNTTHSKNKLLYSEPFLKPQNFSANQLSAIQQKVFPNNLDYNLEKSSEYQAEQLALIAQYPDLIIQMINPKDTYRLAALAKPVRESICTLLLEKAPYILTVQLLINSPGILFSPLQEQELITKHAKLIVNHITPTNFLSLPCGHLLANAIMTDATPDRIVAFFLRKPDFFSLYQQETVIEKYGNLLLEALPNAVLWHWASKECTPLSKFIINQAPASLISKCFLNHPKFFNQEQHALIVATHADILLQNLNVNHITNWPRNFITPLSNLIATRAPAPLAIDCLLHNDDFFLEEEQHIIISAHAESILNIPWAPNQKHNNFRLSKKSSQRLLALKALTMQKKQPHLTINLFTQAPSFFSEDEKTHLVRLYAINLQELFKQPVKTPDEVLHMLKQLPNHFSWLMIEIISKNTPLNDLVSSIGHSSHLPNNKPTAPHPLFSTYLTKYPEQFFRLLDSRIKHPHFYALIPHIIEYAKGESASDKNRITLFHGQKSDWIFLEEIYRRLLELKTGIASPQDFKHLRFYEHSSLSEEQLFNLRKKNVNLSLKYDFSNKLFTNLNPFANDGGSNSYMYATNNSDNSSSSSFERALKKMFEDLGFTWEYEEIKDQLLPNDKVSNAYDSFVKAIKEKGNHGQLLAISMPKELARKLSYSTDPGARPFPLDMNGQYTIDTVEIAKQYNDAPLDNAFILFLSQEIINRDAAQKAGVKIISFNPVTHQKTEKYIAFEKQLETIIELIKKISEKNARKNFYYS